MLPFLYGDLANMTLLIFFFSLFISSFGCSSLFAPRERTIDTYFNRWSSPFNLRAVRLIQVIHL